MATRIGHLREATYTPISRPFDSARFYLLAKRVLDILISAVALIVLALPMAIIALIIMIDSPGPAIFRQRRVRGNQGRWTRRPDRNTFTFYKFRSMYRDADQRMHQRYVEQAIQNGSKGLHKTSIQKGGLYKLADDPRVTRVGRFLRRTSLDELPQLWNVLRGSMSLVGPRPAIPYEVTRYKGWHRQRLEVVPGVTGLWQVNGRSRLAFDEMVRLDIEYTENRSLGMDLAILLRTLPSVINCKDTC